MSLTGLDEQIPREDPPRIPRIIPEPEPIRVPGSLELLVIPMCCLILIALMFVLGR